MSLENAILLAIHDAGYIVRKREDADGFTVEAQDVRDGHRYVVRAPELVGAATELAIKLGFDLEE